MRFGFFVWLFLVADLTSKHLAEALLVDEKPLIISDFLKLEISHNPHLAFSIPLPAPLQIIFSVLLLTGFGWYLRQNRPLTPGAFWGGTLVFGGALANLYERVFFGAVTDFIAFSFWPSFNLADTFIVLGAFILLFSDFEKKRK